MKLKRGKKNDKGLSQWSAVGTLMHVGSKTFGERQLEIFSWEMQFTFPTSRSKYWLDKDFAFVRVFGTIRATRKTGDKALRCFTILTLTLFLRVYISDSPLRQPKDSGNAKMLVACLRVVSLRCQFFSDIFTKQPHPCPRKSLGWGGFRLMLDCVENCGQA